MVLSIFDVAILLVDEYVGEEARALVARGVRGDGRVSLAGGGRVGYLCGGGEGEGGGWLFLCSRGAGGGPSGGPSGGRGGSGGGKGVTEVLKRYEIRPWEMLSEPTPNVGENDTSLSLVLFGAGR